MVADYGQLELRILAAMADCKSMQEAFRLGGDFHSRTALGMYDNIKEAIKAGRPCHVSTCASHVHADPSLIPGLSGLAGGQGRRSQRHMYTYVYVHALCLCFSHQSPCQRCSCPSSRTYAETCILEWDGGEDHKPSPTPLLKDMFANERKKAKILNFSIAYGKTAHGLAKDWGTSLSEAEETVERWYSDRPEVGFPACSSCLLGSSADGHADSPGWVLHCGVCMRHAESDLEAHGAEAWQEAGAEAVMLPRALAS